MLTYYNSSRTVVIGVDMICAPIPSHQRVLSRMICAPRPPSLSQVASSSLFVPYHCCCVICCLRTLLIQQQNPTVTHFCSTTVDIRPPASQRFMIHMSSLMVLREIFEACISNLVEFIKIQQAVTTIHHPRKPFHTTFFYWNNSKSNASI